MPDRCRSCKAPIRWAVTEAGRPIPLDLEPVDAGNVRLDDARVPGGAPIAVIVFSEDREAFAGELYLSHFATCPYAQEHRRR